jgi:hypothetical protein
MSNETDDKTKQEYIGNFIRALAQVEAEMLPYQEQWVAFKGRVICCN